MGLFVVPQKEVAACAAQLNGLGAQSYSDLRANHCLESILPTVYQLRDGHIIALKLRRLVHARQPDRAAQLLLASPRRRSWFPF
jgi:hypothetical protein